MASSKFSSSSGMPSLLTKIPAWQNNNNFIRRVSAYIFSLKGSGLKTVASIMVINFQSDKMFFCMLTLLRQLAQDPNNSILISVFIVSSHHTLLNRQVTLFLTPLTGDLASVIAQLLFKIYGNMELSNFKQDWLHSCKWPNYHTGHNISVSFST